MLVSKHARQARADSELESVRFWQKRRLELERPPAVPVDSAGLGLGLRVGAFGSIVINSCARYQVWDREKCKWREALSRPGAFYAKMAERVYSERKVPPLVLQGDCDSLHTGWLLRRSSGTPPRACGWRDERTKHARPFRQGQTEEGEDAKGCTAPQRTRLS